MAEIDILDLILPGERIDLQTYVEEDEDENGTSPEKEYYVSKVYDVREDGMVEILMPMERAKMILLSVNEEFEVYFYARRGIYTCVARVADRYRDENVSVAVLELETPLKKQQRREYFRYCCMIGMTTRPLAGEEIRDYEEDRFLNTEKEPEGKCVIVDISGGGMRFVSAENYERDQMVYCKFILNYKGEARIYNTVVRIIDIREVGNHTGKKEYRGQFIGISNFERESIIRFIFEEERKMRQNR
ncbi:MAG: hypothetical protein E7285_05135 [Lachnospiraceae bacterium]|nr:hypothetical protein [Lachnospiraceae bacterium]